MRTLNRLIPPGTRLAKPLLARAAVLTLAFDERRKSRLATTLDTGEEIGVMLPRGTVLADGDILIADDGGLVRVVAAPQPVLRVSGTTALALTRAAYHLGNRHTPVEIGDGYLQIEDDPVLADMLLRLGMKVEQANRPFTPETGAYGGGHKHGHDETFAEDYAIAQQVFGEHHGHEQGHEHEHGDAHGHAHQHAGEHSHDHGHGHKHAGDHAHGHGHGHHACDHSHGHDHSHSHDQEHSHSHDQEHKHGHDHKHAGEHTHKHSHD
ncbi:Urease accessory protein UreE [Pararobbsia alpina]|uniref:Urease accessory protein UreE n=1 Tax=Pararobbsia alpina TaxID=621374 RepID=A0A6S7B9X9_9BURK|nr:Urease accessory protein UreE [Pararobbsia alpina]